MQMHYLDEGQGPVVVLLHGNPTVVFYRDLVVRLKSAGYRCIVPDHVGCGLSDKRQDYLTRWSNGSRMWRHFWYIWQSSLTVWWCTTGVVQLVAAWRVEPRTAA